MQSGRSGGSYSELCNIRVLDDTRLGFYLEGTLQGPLVRNCEYGDCSYGPIKEGTFGISWA